MAFMSHCSEFNNSKQEGMKSTCIKLKEIKQEREYWELTAMAVSRVGKN